MLNYEFPPLGGGASPVSYEISKGYVSLGHSVTVVTMAYKSLLEHEVKDGIEIYRVPCLRSKKEICHPWEQLTYILSARKFLKQHLKNHKYDINHTHFIIPVGIISLWLKKKYNLPYVITSHGSDVLGYNPRFKYLYPLIKHEWRNIIKNAKAIIAPSKFLYDQIKKYTSEGKLIIISNGIEPNKFKPMEKEKKILVVTRLFSNKGVQNILDALRESSLKEKGWGVDIVGDGPYRKFLENKCKNDNLTNLVNFHGWIDNESDEMKKFYGKSKLFLTASYFENFGITILEAIQSGCYVLASDIDGYKQLGLNKEHYFKVKDPQDLKIKLEKLIEQKGELKVEKLNKTFEWENIIKKYENILLRQSD
jgi:glycosyltransferase involved in cell wall biosynthesis